MYELSAGWSRADCSTADRIRGHRHASQLSMWYLYTQGVTKRCRLSWLTNRALVYDPNEEGGEGGCGGSQPMSAAVYIT
jgi:hypothetical protein